MEAASGHSAEITKAGAGDCFYAGLIAALACDIEIPQAGRIATAIVAERESTTHLPAGDTARVSGEGNLLIDVSAREGSTPP